MDGIAGTIWASQTTELHLAAAATSNVTLGPDAETSPKTSGHTL
jgi:hypothetical protein